MTSKIKVISKNLVLVYEGSQAPYTEYYLSVSDISGFEASTTPSFSIRIWAKVGFIGLLLLFYSSEYDMRQDEKKLIDLFK